MSKILVIGGGGFIGVHLTSALMASGHTVRVLQRTPNEGLAGLIRRTRVEALYGDISDPAAVTAAVDGQEYVFHLASTTLPKGSNDSPRYDITSNVGGSIELLQAAARQGVKRLIFASSGGTVYGKPQSVPIAETHPTDPITSYGIGKLAIEKYLALFRHLHGLDSIALRVANPYGPHQRVDSGQGAIAVFLDRAMRSVPIEIWGDGEVVRDFIHVTDVVDAFIGCLSYSGAERIMNVGGGQGTSLNQIVRAIEQALDRKIAVNYSAARSLDAATNVLDIERIKSALGWSPKIALSDGIRSMVQFHQTMASNAGG